MSTYNLRKRSKPIITDFPDNPNDSEIENLSESEPDEAENNLDSSSSSASSSDDEPVSSNKKTVKKM